jgi:hypothetical protein
MLGSVGVVVESRKWEVGGIELRLLRKAGSWLQPCLLVAPSERDSL